MSTRYRLGRLAFGLTLVITEVAGPPVLPGRLSSWLIRGAMAADAGRSSLEVCCDMAQAFKIPTEAYSRPRRRSPCGASQGTLHADRRSRPIRPTGSITGIWAGQRL